MKIITIYLVLFITSIISMYGQTAGTSSTTLLQKDNLIITNRISTLSAPIDQRVVSIVDTENQIGSDPISVYSNPQWNSQQIGNLTKAIYDEEGNIYVAASSSYISESKVNSWRYGDIGGGEDDLNAAGSIYRLDAYTGEASVLTRVPQQQSVVGPIIFITFSAQRLTGPGIADIAYDYDNQQILAANNEDGKIYRTDKTGALTNVYDPGLADNGAAGFAPKTERITAIAVAGNKVYYAISNNTSSYVASYKIKNNQTTQSNSEQVEVLLSDIPEITDPNLPITDINLIEDNVMSISQSNMLNEVTILSENLSTILLKKNASTWQLDKLFNGSTLQVDLTNKSNVYLNYTEDNEEVQLWYGGSDRYKNNYLFSANFESLPQMPNVLTSNYTAHQIPDLLGSIKTVLVAEEDKLINLSKNKSINENNDEDNNEDKSKSINENDDENNNEDKNRFENDNGKEDEDGNSKTNRNSLKIEVYPNPARTFFEIKNLPPSAINAIYLYSLNGKLLKFDNNVSAKVNVSNLDSGVYIVKVQTKDNLFIKKVLIQ